MVRVVQPATYIKNKESDKNDYVQKPFMIGHNVLALRSQTLTPQ